MAVRKIKSLPILTIKLLFSSSNWSPFNGVACTVSVVYRPLGSLERVVYFGRDITNNWASRYFYATSKTGLTTGR